MPSQQVSPQNSDSRHLDPKHFARIGGRLAGVAAVAALHRVEEFLFDRSGEVAYHLEGSMNPRGRPEIHLTITGRLNIRCERCLGGFGLPLDIESRLEFVARESDLGEVSEEPESIDSVFIEGRFDVLEWLEDEILLALPPAPCHDDGLCQPDSPEEEGDETAEKWYPFAQLNVIKGD